LLTEYYRLVTNDVRKSEWIAVRPEVTPPETGMVWARFLRPREEPAEPCVTPDAPGSSWKKLGLAAGPFQSNLGDGSVVTYFWYRFADQPAQLNADLTDQERENLQARLEKLQRVWRKDREYLPAPRIGKLAELDPAVLVAPPAGLEVGYVPIVTHQEKRLK